MTLHERVKQVREFRRLSQENVALELGLSQSQYSRRENGEILFNVEELQGLSKILNTKISELYGEETIVFNLNTQNGGNFGQYVTSSDQLIDQYEKRLQEKDQLIEYLKNLLEIKQQKT